MLRLTRPLLHRAFKSTTGITGLAVHPNPLPELAKTYEATLAQLQTLPPTSAYRRSAEVLTQRKLKIVLAADSDVAAVEKELDEGQIEESLDIAHDELKLVSKVAQWKAWVSGFPPPPFFFSYGMLICGPLADGRTWRSSRLQGNGSTLGNSRRHDPA